MIDFPFPISRPRALLRVFVPPGTTRPLAAVAPPTYRGLRRGEVTVESTFAGRATVVVRRAGREVGRAEADVPAGASTLTLAEAPPRGDLAVALEVTGPGGRVAGDRLEVSTVRRLGGRRARALIGFAGELFGGGRRSVGDCRRTGPRGYRCTLRLTIERRDGSGGRRCVARLLVQQRPDGRRVIVDGRPCV